jgi:hypothetical protein
MEMGQKTMGKKPWEYEARMILFSRASTMSLKRNTCFLPDSFNKSVK